MAHAPGGRASLATARTTSSPSGNSSPMIPRRLGDATEDELEEVKRKQCLEEKRAEWARLVARKIVGANPYQITEKMFMTLIQITGNIIEHFPEGEEFQRIKTSSKKLNEDVLKHPGGEDAMRELGFRRTVLVFVEYLVCKPHSYCVSSRGLQNGGRITRYEHLKLAHEMLLQRLPEVRERAEFDREEKKREAKLGEAEEARKKDILLDISEDRERVARRVAAEKRRRFGAQQVETDRENRDLDAKFQQL